ncbi:MAG: type II toxin-antitoxin system HicA family toxin [Dehalococcoidia bacterium]|nr:type II toxin-antitoxin system HicA family toxin [Dehalococcoidia bacterium]
MTRLPRDISGQQLALALSRLGYAPVRQVGSHLRLQTMENGEHHVTVPLHPSVHVGTLASILRDVGAHAGLERAELIERLFGPGHA